MQAISTVPVVPHFKAGVAGIPFRMGKVEAMGADSLDRKEKVVAGESPLDRLKRLDADPRMLAELTKKVAAQQLVREGPTVRASLAAVGKYLTRPDVHTFA